MGLIPDVAAVVLDDVAAQGEPEAQTLAAILGRPMAKPRAVHEAKKVKAGELDPPDITEQIFAQHLYTRNVPDPDVLIRTSGEMRVSNFLLWQISYTELVVTQTLWPDFRKPQLYEAIEEYNRRHRRFGAI